MSDELAMIAAVGMMSLFYKRRSNEPKPPEQKAAEEHREKDRILKEAAAKLAAEQREREEMERAPRAFRRRQIKAQRKAQEDKANGG